MLWVTKRAASRGDDRRHMFLGDLQIHRSAAHQPHHPPRWNIHPYYNQALINWHFHLSRCLSASLETLVAMLPISHPASRLSEYQICLTKDRLFAPSFLQVFS